MANWTKRTGSKGPGNTRKTTTHTTGAGKSRGTTRSSSIAVGNVRITTSHKSGAQGASIKQTITRKIGGYTQRQVRTSYSSKSDKALFKQRPLRTKSRRRSSANVKLSAGQSTFILHTFVFLLVLGLQSPVAWGLYILYWVYRARGIFSQDN